MGKRNMKAVLCLNNFFQWSGGMSQYVNWATKEAIPYPHLPPYDWTKYQEYSAIFFTNKKAQRWFKAFLRKIIKRTNSINGMDYREDPTIMAWQLANEPRGFSKKEQYIDWVVTTSAYIKKLDANHLVSLGGEGLLPDESIGTAFNELSQLGSLDYLTMHLWIENWQWYKPKQVETYSPAFEQATAYLDRHLPIALAVNKPIVLEEFGISKDEGNYDPHAKTAIRDKYFTAVFEYIYQKASAGQAVAGANFWSWSGEGTPPRPGEMWTIGDPLTGDPPHEFQGWYSVYTHDTSTLAIIQKYTEMMSLYRGDETQSTN